MKSAYFWNCFGRCKQVHSDDECDPNFSLKQFAVGYVCQLYSSSRSPVAVVSLLSKFWSESDRVIWKWIECR